MTKRLAVPRRVLRELSREQLLDLEDFIRELLRGLPSGKERGLSEGVEGQRGGGKTYRLVLTRCGKERCRCASGELHGPYWYAYWSECGRTRSQYIGKKLPAQKNKMKRR